MSLSHSGHVRHRSLVFYITYGRINPGHHQIRTIYTTQDKTFPIIHIICISIMEITPCTIFSNSMNFFYLQCFQIVRKEDDSMSNISKSMPSLLETHCASYPINSQTASNIVHYIYCHFRMFSIKIV